MNRPGSIKGEHSNYPHITVTTTKVLIFHCNKREEYYLFALFEKKNIRYYMLQENTREHVSKHR